MKIITRQASPEAVEKLTKSGQPLAMARLLAARGVTSPEEMLADGKVLPLISKLKGVVESAQRLVDAIKKKELICVVADYDCDGATACAVMLRAISKMGGNITFVVPDRKVNGYGLSPEVVDLAIDRYHPALLLTVDNGIASVEGVRYARSKGLDVVVTDHHLPGDVLPDTPYMVNPNQPGCTFPTKAMAGVGVAAYVTLGVAHLATQQGVNHQYKLFDVIDLVALGTVADVVPLDQTNRAMVRMGLDKIRSGRACAGINALFAVAERKPELAVSWDLGFLLGPRINAAGRLADMSTGIRTLATDKSDEAAAGATMLDQYNRERKDIEGTIRRQAEDQVNDIVAGMKDGQTPSTIVAYRSGWHIGVVGIVASRLKDNFQRPTFVFAKDELSGTLKGSGRSVPGIHLRDALDAISKQHPDILPKFGGHAAAAGCTLRSDLDIPAFQAAFNEYAATRLPKSVLENWVESDGALDASEITVALASLIESGIWGQGFPMPTFHAHAHVLDQRILKGKHLKARLKIGNGIFEAIQFFEIDPLPAEVDLVYSLGVSDFEGRRTPNLIIQAAGRPEVPKHEMNVREIDKFHDLQGLAI